MNRPIWLTCFEEMVVSRVWYQLNLKKFFNKELMLNISRDMPLAGLAQSYGVDRVCWLDEVMKGCNKSLKEKSLLEVGPGGLLLQGLLFQSLGAEYAALDAFQGDCLSKRAKNIYRRFKEEASRMDLSPLEGDWCAIDVEKIRYFPLIPVEKGAQVFNQEKFDVIFSHGVLEHLYDINSGFSTFASLLSEDGITVHNVDFHPHDYWRNYQNPHTHLTIPPILYKMAFPKLRGFPNRLRHSDYLKAIEKSGLKLIELRDYEYYPDTVLSIREKLPKQFSHYSDEDLLIMRVTYVCSLA